MKGASFGDDDLAARLAARDRHTTRGPPSGLWHHAEYEVLDDRQGGGLAVCELHLEGRLRAGHAPLEHGDGGVIRVPPGRNVDRRRRNGGIAACALEPVRLVRLMLPDGEPALPLAAELG